MTFCLKLIVSLFSRCIEASSLSLFHRLFLCLCFSCNYFMFAFSLIPADKTIFVRNSFFPLSLCYQWFLCFSVFPLIPRLCLFVPSLIPVCLSNLSAIPLLLCFVCNSSLSFFLLSILFASSVILIYVFFSFSLEKKNIQWVPFCLSCFAKKTRKKKICSLWKTKQKCILLFGAFLKIVLFLPLQKKKICNL